MRGSLRSDADRERYKQALEGNKNYIAGQLQVNAALERSGLLTDEQRQQTKTATEAMRQAYADFAAGEQQHLAQASKSVNDYVADIQKAKSEAEGLANSSLGDVFKTAGLDFEQISGRVGKTVQTFVDGLQQMEQATSVTGPAINAYLTKAFDSTKNQTELDALISKVNTLHNQGKLVGDDYISSLGAAANAAKALSATNSEASQTYIDLLKQQKAAAEEAYKTTGLDQYKAKVGEINQAIDKATNAQKKNVTASNELEQAFADLGMKSAAQLEDLAAKAESAYSKMATAGSASLTQQKEAFLIFAKAELEAANASDRLPSSLLESQAAALSLTKEFDALKTSVTTMGAEAIVTSNALTGLAKAQGDVDASNKKAQQSTSAWNDSVDQLEEELLASRDEIRTVTVATNDLNKASEFASMSTSDLTDKLEELRSNLKLAQSAAYSYNNEYSSLFVGQALKTAEFNYQIAQSTLAVKELQEALSETPSDKLINQAEHALIKFKDLGDENLSGLKSAIDSAKQKMDSLTDSVQSGLNSLKDELDELDANQAAIENRRYQTQLDEWQGKLAEARKTGNKEIIEAARDALRLAEEVHNRKLATIKAEQDAAATTVSTSKNTTTSTNVATTSPDKVITIKLAGKTATVKADAANEAALDSIIAQLESASALTSS